MSCQAGMWNFDGRPIDREFLGKLGESIDQYGPDGADALGRGGPGEYIQGPLAMIYRPFHTNKESRLERQPYVSKLGHVMTWDGRLDNREELISALHSELSTLHNNERTDVAIVMAAWEAWGTECFKKLIGDFSLAVWDSNTRTLTLAKDFIGVRYLYYEILPEGVGGSWDRYPYLTPESGAGLPPNGPCVWWCSRLEPLILYSGRQYELNEEYIAGYFAFHPANHITPYMGVHALPAGHYVQIRPPAGAGSQISVSPQTAAGLKKWFAGFGNGRSASHHSPPASPELRRATRLPRPGRGHSPLSTVTLTQYWHFDPDKRITYKTDAEYEEHFRHVFFQSVKRRLRADAPIVAGLSGGRDSSAIVCVADELIARGEAETPRLDTYSRYDEEEPFGNDKPYLTIVEQKRGRTGHHLLAVPETPVLSHSLRPLNLYGFSAHPGADQSDVEAVQKRMEFMKANEYRLILSGIGGDEVTGGVPNSIAELADLLVQRRLITLAKRCKAWGLAQKRTWTSLVWDTLSSVQPDYIHRTFWTKRNLWTWLNSSFIARYRDTFLQGAAAGAPDRGAPSFRSRVAGATGVSWQLGSTAKLHRRGVDQNCYDRGFPFLDRDFLEFMFAIPREQILRPGQYRSLMRRALAGIVPDGILNRTRKAFAMRRPALGIQSTAIEIKELLERPFIGGSGWINPVEFLRSVDDLAAGRNDLSLPVRRTIALEMWFRSLADRGKLKGAQSRLESKERILESVA